MSAWTLEVRVRLTTILTNILELDSFAKVGSLTSVRGAAFLFDFKFAFASVNIPSSSSRDSGGDRRLAQPEPEPVYDHRVGGQLDRGFVPRARYRARARARASLTMPVEGSGVRWLATSRVVVYETGSEG